MSRHRSLRALFGLAIAVPLAALGHGLTGYAAPAGTKLTAAQAAQLSQGANKSVIVVLRNQHADLYGRVHSAARASAIHADQAPILSELSAVGAEKVTAYSLVNMIAAHVSSNEIAHLESNPAVQAVVPNLKVPKPQIPRLDLGTGSTASLVKSQLSYPAASACTGTPNNPQLNPEALQVTNDAFDNPNTPQAVNLADGSGVLVATIADGLDTSQPDFQRLPGSPDYIKDGPQVITQYVDFTGNGLNGQTGGGEMFGDASSIAAQGNTAYDVEQSIAPGLRPYAHCYVKVVGMAPGANVMAITTNFTFADVVLAIQYAVQHGANVINESFGEDLYPDIATNPIDLANDAATAQNVTVVVSSGDAGSQNTVGWPATDPNVIDVGATTTYRSNAQLASPYHIPGWNGSWESNQLSGLSTAGISYNGNSTIDVVAPGDLNWALCSDKLLAPNVPQYTDCGGLNFENFGGTSESSPLTAGEAALIIDAYGRTHNGAAPTPQIVKEIIKGTATNLDLPSYEQGAGLINALAAVKAAMAYNGPDGLGSPSQSCPGTASTGTQCSSLVYSTGNVQDALVGKGQPGTEQHFAFKVTNQGAKPVAVRPLVQMLGAASPTHYTLNFPTCGCVHLVRVSSGGSGYDPNSPPTVTFAAPSGGGTAAQGTAIVDNDGSVVGVTVTDPGSGYTLADNPVQVTFTDPNGSGAAATGQLDNAAGTPTVINSSGSTRVFEEQAFTVSPGTKHLSTTVSFPDNYNGDFIRIVLLDPSNAMAAYSIPQGPRAQWGISEVADPAPGTWHAFVVLNRHVFVGPVALDVTQQKFVSAGSVSPVSTTLLPGKTATFQMDTHTPAKAGDQSEDVVLNGTIPGGKISTDIPVVLRSLVPLNPVSGGSFSGILTGGNGRGSFGGNNAAEQILNYEFNVPAGEQDLDLSLNVNDPGYVLGGILVSPNGDADYQSNLLTGNTMQLFQRNPAPGAWHFVVFIDVFSSGNQTAEPFTGQIRFNQAAQNISNNLPNTPNWSIQAGNSQQFTINITNPGSTPESLFADPRLAGQQEAFPVAGYGGGSPDVFVYYPAVPAESTEFSVFSESASSPSQPISTDIYDTNGPPIPAGAQSSPSVIGSNFVDPNTGNFASVATMTGQEVPPGEWESEAIPAPPYANGATDAGIEQYATALTQTFDPNAAVSTGNFWLAANQVQGAAPYTPLNLNPTQNGQITVTLSPPQGTTGQLIKGVIYIETMPVLGDPIQFNQLTGSPDELIAIPYEYTVS